MKREELVLACTSDVAGKLRGKAFPSCQLEKRVKSGIGWTPTNVQITCFDIISNSPFGSFGDLILIPDPEAMLTIEDDTGPDEKIVLGDIKYTNGDPWEFCTRSILRSALERLERLTGLTIKGAFEHEFQIKNQPTVHGTAFSSTGFREWRPFAESVVSTMRENNIQPDTFLKEFGPGQFEVTMEPATGVSIADQAVFLKEIVHATAKKFDVETTFVPICAPDSVGNGVHVHMSLVDSEGDSVTHDAEGKHQLSEVAGQFIAGVVKHLDSIIALTAPSEISYLRLTPHRWSSAFNNLGVRDREAAVRICPVSEISGTPISKQFHFEFRAADAAASPHLLLAALIHAGVQGVEDQLEIPEATEEDLSLLPLEKLLERGIVRLPQNLGDALDNFKSNPYASTWFSAKFVEVYEMHKRGEIEYVGGRSQECLCELYEGVY